LAAAETRQVPAERLVSMSFFDELRRRNVFRVGIAYTVVAWLVAQAADLFLENFNAPDWVIQTVLVMLVLGLPLALFFAWAFELTPEGVKREKDIDRSQSVTARTGRKLDYAIIALLVLALGYFVWESRFSGEPSAAADENGSEPLSLETTAGSGEQVTDKRTLTPSHALPNSIAVLPFVNMSNDADNEFFSEGVSEEILNVLARIPELKVAARTSAFAFKGTPKTISEIARELRVSNVLEGSVRKSGNQVRVTAQLIKADDGFHLWSETYDRQLDNIFAIQDEIANSIANELKLTLDLDAGSSGNLTGTNSIAAYEYYLQGMAKWHLRTPANLFSAIDDFNQATDIDPGFARAYAGAALAWTVLPGYIDYDRADAWAHTLEQAERALQLDPNLAEAYAALGNYAMEMMEVEQSAAYYERSIELNPSFATAYQWYGRLLGFVGDLDKALEKHQRAWDLDPRSRIIGYNYALDLLRAGRMNEAVDINNTVIGFAPDFPDARELAMLSNMINGDCQAVAEHGHALARVLDKVEDRTDVFVGICDAPDDAARARYLDIVFGWPADSFANPESPTLVYDDDFGVALIEMGLVEPGLVLAERILLEGGAKSDIAWFRSSQTPNGRAFSCDPRTVAIFERAQLPPRIRQIECESP
jgi:TolB-like protein